MWTSKYLAWRNVRKEWFDNDIKKCKRKFIQFKKHKRKSNTKQKQAKKVVWHALHTVQSRFIQKLQNTFFANFDVFNVKPAAVFILYIL